MGSGDEAYQTACAAFYGSLIVLAGLGNGGVYSLGIESKRVASCSTWVHACMWHSGRLERLHGFGRYHWHFSQTLLTIRLDGWCGRFGYGAILLRRLLPQVKATFTIVCHCPLTVLLCVTAPVTRVLSEIMHLFVAERKVLVGRSMHVSTVCNVDSQTIFSQASKPYMNCFVRLSRAAYEFSITFDRTVSPSHRHLYSIASSACHDQTISPLLSGSRHGMP